MVHTSESMERQASRLRQAYTVCTMFGGLQFFDSSVCAWSSLVFQWCSFVFLWCCLIFQWLSLVFEWFSPIFQWFPLFFPMFFHSFLQWLFIGFHCFFDCKYCTFIARPSPTADTIIDIPI